MSMWGGHGGSEMGDSAGGGLNYPGRGGSKSHHGGPGKMLFWLLVLAAFAALVLWIAG